MIKSLNYALIEVVEGRWLEVSFIFHRWRWGISLEVFTCWTGSYWSLDQAPGPWFYQDDGF